MATAAIGPVVGIPNVQILPAATKVKSLNATHPEYAFNRDTWLALDLLYRGGAIIRQNAPIFLVRKPKELPDVYAARCQMFTYQNILSAGIDYYLAAVFRKAPEIDFKVEGPDGQMYDVPNVPDQIKAYYAAFQKNCDGKGTQYVDFWRDILKNLLLYQRSWVLIDLPKKDTPILSRWDQQNPTPYVVNFQPSQVINWNEDDYGALEWVVIKTVQQKQQWLGEPVTVTRWYKFDRQRYEIWEAVENNRNAYSMADEQNAQMVDTGFHALAELNQVPVDRIEVPEGLWLANRVLPQVLDHLNTDNEYKFALFNSNLAMPVIIGNVSEVPTMSVAGYLHLPENSAIQWTEPSGTSFERSEIRVQSLREEIYRQMYLMAQGRSAQDAPGVQSGYSKELDMAPAAEIQNIFASIIRNAMKRKLDQVAHIRGDRIVHEVRGMTMPFEVASTEMQDAMTFDQLMIPSEIARRASWKKVLSARFPEASHSEMQAMFDEIDEAPTREEEAQMQQDQERQQFDNQFQQQIAGQEEQANIQDASAEASHERDMESKAFQHQIDTDKMDRQAEIDKDKAKDQSKLDTEKGKALEKAKPKPKLVKK